MGAFFAKPARAAVLKKRRPMLGSLFVRGAYK